MHRQSMEIQKYIILNSADTISPAEADEAYVIGRRGQYTPVGAYLAGDEIIKIALQHDVNMIHPGLCSRKISNISKVLMVLGYGFLSENAEFARNVEKAGLIVGHSAFSEIHNG